MQGRTLTSSLTAYYLLLTAPSLPCSLCRRSRGDAHKLATERDSCGARDDTCPDKHRCGPAGLSRVGF